MSGPEAGADLVVGSGPAGVAASLALLERGRRVTMLDHGLGLEPEAANLAAPAAGKPLEQWPEGLRERLQSLEGPLEDGLPTKTVFGSDFAVRRDPDHMPLEIRDAQILLSLARGGLSNLWGANAWPFGPDDLTGWPIGEAELRDGYRAVLRHVPLAAVSDPDFDRDFPLYADRLEPRPLSTPAVRMLEDLAPHRDALRSRGVRVTPSRLAMRVAPAAGSPGCVRCGCCLHGCPLDLIYRSGMTLETLRRHPGFRYEGGHHVVRFAERDGSVEVETRRVPGREPATFRGERLFLAAGAWSTARIVLESRDDLPAERTMLESQYFLIPILHHRRFAGIESERLTTLSQLCFRLRDPAFGARDVHVLLYTYNPLYPKLVSRSPAGWVPGLAREVVARLSSLQGYLHSDVSPRFAIRLRRAGGDAPSTLVVEGRTSPESARIVRRVLGRFRSIAGAMRATPVPFMTRIGAPGKSYHGGGTFPMRAAPGAADTDRLGRLGGGGRVHLVDASVFPTVPATNVTLTVMANAWRIAAESTAGEARPAGGGA